MDLMKKKKATTRWDKVWEIMGRKVGAEGVGDKKLVDSA